MDDDDDVDDGDRHTRCTQSCMCRQSCAGHYCEEDGKDVDDDRCNLRITMVMMMMLVIFLLITTMTTKWMMIMKIVMMLMMILMILMILMIRSELSGSVVALPNFTLG